MYIVNDDRSIYATRGDVVAFSVSAMDGEEAYVFQPGDVVRIKVYGRKDAETVVLQKDFPVYEASETVDILLTKEDTKIGGVISKPTDYWYEVELNPFSYPQTIIGYDEDGAKVFRLLPEGRDLEEYEIKEEDIPIVDRELDPTSTRPVENQAIAREMIKQNSNIEKLRGTVSTAQSQLTDVEITVGVERARIDNLLAGAYYDPDAELGDIRVDIEGTIHGSAGAAVRHQISEQNALRNELEKAIVWRSPNVLNPDTISKNKTINIDTGEIIDDSTGAMLSDFIRIPAGATRITTSYLTNGGVHQAQYLFVGYYDVNKKFLLYQENASDYPIPEGAKWMLVLIGSIFATAYTRLMVEFGTEMSEYCEYGVVKLLDSVEIPRVDKVIEEVKAKINTVSEASILETLFEGNKQIKMIGDSITQGVGGSGFAQNGEVILDVGDTIWNANNDGVCHANMFKKYIEGKFPSCTVKNYGTKSESYYSMVNTSVDKLSQLVEGNDDLVIMMFGTNDRIHSANVHTMIENASRVIEYITETRGKTLVMATSLPASVADETLANKNFHMEDVDMANSYLAQKYGLQHISIYREFIRRTENSGKAIDDYLSDGLHPNDDGYNMIFNILCDKLGIAVKRPKAIW